MENPLMISSMDSGYNIIDEISSAKTISSKGVICKDCRKKLERDFEIQFCYERQYKCDQSTHH